MHVRGQPWAGSPLPADFALSRHGPRALVNLPAAVYAMAAAAARSLGEPVEDFVTAAVLREVDEAVIQVYPTAPAQTHEPHRSTRQCSVEGCERKHRARGWCDTHYRRWKRHGHPFAALKIRVGKTTNDFTDAHDRWCDEPEPETEGMRRTAERKAPTALHFGAVKAPGHTDTRPSSLIDSTETTDAATTPGRRCEIAVTCSQCEVVARDVLMRPAEQLAVWWERAAVLVEASLHAQEGCDGPLSASLTTLEGGSDLGCPAGEEPRVADLLLDVVR